MRSVTLLPASLLAASLALPAFAAGGGGSEPKPTETSTTCEDGMVYDEKTKTCIKSSASILNDDIRYVAARELAYSGRYDSAMMVLDSAENQDDPRILNYRGFVHRKQGDLTLAMQFYNRALAQDPDYILARSYMGQGLIAQGDLTGALVQLREIEARGGRDTWAYAALDQALRGIPTDY
ncbi:tetratricopeptide repeat protein [Pseudooceanicola sp. LIPI14-2-Ac024]|uniref:tetratricopeptide repeat protein n=1 Tax=Pseudooceanicola sp. LIPI14-2-Ac024 TaxID=3344875 RepID=UPI0035CF99F3